MLSLFGKKSTPVLGIDISATAIKLLELGGSPGKYRVESYSVEPLPPNSVVDKNISDEHAVGEAIGKAVKKSGTKLREAAVAVAGSAVITKIISMPANISERDMETQINLEADQYIPFPLEEVNIDFEIIGPSAQSDDQVDILLAASRSENIDLRVASLNVGGLKARVVDVEAFALENAIGLLAHHLGVGEGSTIAIADVGSAITTYSVLEDFKIIYSREQNFGGAQQTEDPKTMSPRYWIPSNSQWHNKSVVRNNSSFHPARLQRSII